MFWMLVLFYIPKSNSFLSLWQKPVAQTPCRSDCMLSQRNSYELSQQSYRGTCGHNTLVFYAKECSFLCIQHKPFQLSMFLLSNWNSIYWSKKPCLAYDVERAYCKSYMCNRTYISMADAIKDMMWLYEVLVWKTVKTKLFCLLWRQIVASENCPILLLCWIPFGSFSKLAVRSLLQPTSCCLHHINQPK